MRKSISAPRRYGALNGSTTTVTPCASTHEVALLDAAVEAERVLEARAAAALDGDAQHVGLALRLAGLQLLDLRGRRLREGDEDVRALEGRHGPMVAAALPVADAAGRPTL